MWKSKLIVMLVLLMLIALGGTGLHAQDPKVQQRSAVA